MAETILEQEAQKASATPQATPHLEQNAQAEAIAERLAQFRKTTALIEFLPDGRAEAGCGPLPDDAIADAYEEREAALL